MDEHFKQLARRWMDGRGITDADFTEPQEALQGLHSTMRWHQLSDSGMRKVTESDLFYMAGHADPSDDPDWSTSERQKFAGNILRARAEIGRRRQEAEVEHAEKLAEQARRAGFWAAGIGAVVGILVVIIGAKLQPAPEVTVNNKPVEVVVTMVSTTTTTPATTTTAP